jgi:hypothetical protein
MSKQSFVRSLSFLFALTVSASAFAAPITRIPFLPMKAVKAMQSPVSQPARGYRDLSARFGVRSEVDTRAVPAR